MIALNIILAVLWTCFVIIPVVIAYNSSDIVTRTLHDNNFHVKNLFDGRVNIMGYSNVDI